MKKFVLTAAVLFLLISGANAQNFGLTLAGRKSVFFGDTYKFPIGTPDKFPQLYGINLQGNYGAGKNRVNIGFTYYLPPEKIDYNYYGITTEVQMMEFDFTYNRYVLKRSFYEDGGVYLLAGAAINYLSLNSNIPDTGVSEAKLFRSRSILGTFVNAGLGAEVGFGGSFLVFGEGKASIHTNAYVDDTTIWDSQLMYFWSATLGVRIPFGQRDEPQHRR